MLSLMKGFSGLRMAAATRHLTTSSYLMNPATEVSASPAKPKTKRSTKDEVQKKAREAREAKIAQKAQKKLESEAFQSGKRIPSPYNLYVSFRAKGTKNLKLIDISKAWNNLTDAEKGVFYARQEALKKKVYAIRDRAPKYPGGAALLYVRSLNIEGTHPFEFYTEKTKQWTTLPEDQKNHFKELAKEKLAEYKIAKEKFMEERIKEMEAEKAQ